MRNALVRLAVLAALLGGLATPHPARAGEPLSAVVISVSVTIWPAIVANKKGYFKDEGLDFEFLDSGSSTRSLQQVAAGSAPIGSSSMVDTMRGIDKGANVRIFLNSLAVGTHSLVGQKTVHSVKELKGKRVMTGGPTDITNLWWMAMAKANGLDGQKDVDLMFSGATTARFAALVAGAVDATMLSTPQSFQAIQDGYADLGPVAPYLGEFPMMIWHVNETWAKTHEKELLAFIRAHNKAVRYMSDPAHKQEVSQMLADASHSKLDDALKTWDLCMKVKAFVPDGAVSDQATERVRDTLISTGDIKNKGAPSAYVDHRFADKVK